MFFFRAARILEAIRRHLPKLGQILDTISADPARAGDLYPMAPSISIDYGVMEKTQKPVYVFKAAFGWSDVGSWSAVHRMMRKDAHGIAGNGRWLELGAKNCLIHAPDRLVVLLGVEDAVVVDTPDALLIADLKRSQDVRELVGELNRKGFGSYTIK